VYWDPDHFEENDTEDAETAAAPGDSAMYEGNGSLVITVHSTGPAPSQEQQQQLEMDDVKFNLNLLGAGDSCELELWICKGIIDLHHGRLFSVVPSEEADSRSLSGSVRCSSGSGGEESVCGDGDSWNRASSWRIELPAVVMRPDALDDLSSDSTGEMKEAEASSTDSILLTNLGYNVLVVEDSIPSRKLLCRLLSNLGCRCTPAGNGIECLEKIHKNLHNNNQPPFDFILMDFEMPRMNGPDAARTLREEGVYTPIIGVTGNVLPEDRQYFLHSGANRVLRKPLSLPLLEKTLVDLIMRKDEISYIM
jgi:CheY-like chemotaxis protein